MLQHFLVIAGMALADVIYTLWARKAAQGKAIWSGFWAAMIIPTYGWVVIMYNHDPIYLVSAGIGAFIGAFIGVKLDTRAKND